MFDQFVQRENLIFHMLQTFSDAKLDFIVIGGYAVSAYKHRFSIDADIVLRRKGLSKFEALLRENKFVKTAMKELNHPYAPIFIRYKRKDTLSVSVDLMVGGVAARQTGAAFGFELLDAHVQKMKILGLEREVVVKVPRREVLIALKLHAGRLTDYRDIVALSKNVDVKLIKKFVARGNMSFVREHIGELMSLIEERGFQDSFKGVFIEKRYDVDFEEVRKLRNLID